MIRSKHDFLETSQQMEKLVFEADIIFGSMFIPYL